MKINSLNHISSINKNIIQKSYMNNVNNDVFVRSEQVSFGRKKKSRADLIKDFAKDVKKYYFDVPFDKNAIEKLIQKDVKDVTVKDFSERDRSIYWPDDFMGLYTEEVCFDDEKEVFLSGKKTLYLKNPNEGEYSKLAYYANCVHEYTHLMQSQDDEFSEIVALNKFYKNSKASSEVKDRTVTLAPQYFIDVEKSVKKPIFDSVNNPILLSKYLNKKPSVTEIYKDNGIDNIKKFASDIMDKKAKEYSKKYGEIDASILKGISILHFKKENEAYQADYDTQKKVDPSIYKSTLEWDKLAKIQLYRILSDLKV